MTRPKFRVHSTYYLLELRYLKKAFSSLPSHGVVLDLGSSISPHRNHFAQCTFFSVDINWDRRPSLVADIHLLPFRDNTADVILLLDVLEHCQSPRNIVQEVQRVLKPDGVCIAVVPFLYKFHPDPSDYYRYTDQALSYLFKDFSKVYLSAFGNRFQCIYELLYQGPLRYIMFPFNHLVAWFNLPGRTSPLGYGILAHK